VRDNITSECEEVTRQQAKKLAPHANNFVLFDSGFDSLCFAVIVARLADTLRFDPLSAEGEVDFSVTLGDFMWFYKNVAR
jgi:hypothetical protein